MNNVFFILMSCSYIPCGVLHSDTCVAAYFEMCILGMTNSFHGKCPVSIIHMYGEKKTSGHFCKFNSPCLMPICIMFVVELISQFYFVCHDKWQWNFSWKWIFHKKCWFFRFQWPLHVSNKGLFIEWIKFLENVFFMSLFNLRAIYC